MHSQLVGGAPAEGDNLTLYWHRPMISDIWGSFVKEAEGYEVDNLEALLYDLIVMLQDVGIGGCLKEVCILSSMHELLYQRNEITPLPRKISITRGSECNQHGHFGLEKINGG